MREHTGPARQHLQASTAASLSPPPPTHTRRSRVARGREPQTCELLCNEWLACRLVYFRRRELLAAGCELAEARVKCN